MVPRRIIRRSFCSFNRSSNNYVAGSKEIAIAFSGGLLAGVCGGLVGMGGAFIAMPILTGPLRLSPHLANGTSMVAVVFTAIGGAYAYSKNSVEGFQDISQENTSDGAFESFLFRIKHASSGQVDLQTAAGVALSGSFFAIFGAKLSAWMSERSLLIARAILFFSLAPSVVLREKLKEWHDSDKAQASDKIDTVDKQSNFFRAMGIGAMSGTQAGLFGVGGGAIVVPMLCLGTDLEYKTAIGTSLAAMIPTAISGSLTHLSQGTVVKQIAVPLGLGCAIGSFYSGRLSHHINDLYLKYSFTGLMCFLGVKTAFIVMKYKR